MLSIVANKNKDKNPIKLTELYGLKAFCWVRDDENEISPRSLWGVRKCYLEGFV